MVTLKESLKGKLPDKYRLLVPSAYDLVGDLAIFSEFPAVLVPHERVIGEGLLAMHKQIKVVLKKVGKYSGQFRTPRLKIIAGERRKKTLLLENGCRFVVHPEKMYWSSRLASERKRIYQQVTLKESVLVMFSGAGPYTISIAKHASPSLLVSVEVNPAAVRYQEENLVLNKIEGVVLKRGRVERLVPRLKLKFDRILMALPRDAEKFLALALSVAKKGCTIHFYTFQNEAKLAAMKQFIAETCKKGRRPYTIRTIVKCGQFGPGLYRYCFDIRLL